MRCGDGCIPITRRGRACNQLLGQRGGRSRLACPSYRTEAKGAGDPGEEESALSSESGPPGAGGALTGNQPFTQGEGIPESGHKAGGPETHVRVTDASAAGVWGVCLGGIGWLGGVNLGLGVGEAASRPPPPPPPCLTLSFPRTKCSGRRIFLRFLKEAADLGRGGRGLGGPPRWSRFSLHPGEAAGSSETPA